MNEVYWDPMTNQLLSIKEPINTSLCPVIHSHVMCSGWANYYDDAITNIVRQSISRRSLNRMRYIDEPRNHTDILYRDHTCLGIYGWRVKESYTLPVITTDWKAAHDEARRDADIATAAVKYWKVQSYYWQERYNLVLQKLRIITDR